MKKRSSLRAKLERYAIPNLSLYLIICYGIGYVLQMMRSPILELLVLDPFQILHGQIWRLVSWIFIPPENSNLFFVLIMMYLYYSLGNLLERIWGTYKYNVYIFSGMLFIILGSIVLWAYCNIVGVVGVVDPFAAGYAGSGRAVGHIYFLENGSALSFAVFSTSYINMSIFLACAAAIPDAEVLLMFLFPIKVKWLGILYGVMLVFQCIEGGLVTLIVILFSLLNFLCFFLSSRGRIRMSVGQVKRQQEFRQKMRYAQQESSRVTKHKCAICGRTEEDGAQLEFRFCSKCEGNYEYCSDHLFTHEHVRHQ